MNNLKISIIVPIFNTAKYLHKCIYSIQNQSYKNIEIVLVNDGSTDNSLDIRNRFAENDKRVIVIDKENNGVSSARNSGLDIASGDYIGFVDSDDYIHQDMYKQLIESSLKNYANIAECGYCVVNDSYNIILSFPLKKDIINGNYECSKAYLQKKNTTNFNVNKLYSKTVLENIRFPKYKYSEDFWFNTKALYKCRRKVTINGCYYYYLNNKKSACNVPFSKSKLDVIESGKDVYEFYKSRFKELSPYVALYVAEHIIGLFRVLKSSSSREMETNYLNTLINEFKNYFKLIDGEAYENIKFTKRQISLLLFNINPELYYLFYKFYQYLK